MIKNEKEGDVEDKKAVEPQITKGKGKEGKKFQHKEMSIRERDGEREEEFQREGIFFSRGGKKKRRGKQQRQRFYPNSGRGWVLRKEKARLGYEVKPKGDLYRSAIVPFKPKVGKNETDEEGRSLGGKRDNSLKKKNTKRSERKRRCLRGKKLRSPAGAKLAEGVGAILSKEPGSGMEKRKGSRKHQKQKDSLHGYPLIE